MCKYFNTRKFFPPIILSTMPEKSDVHYFLGVVCTLMWYSHSWIQRLKRIIFKCSLINSIKDRNMGMSLSFKSMELVSLLQLFVDSLFNYYFLFSIFDYVSYVVQNRLPKRRHTWRCIWISFMPEKLEFTILKEKTRRQTEKNHTGPNSQHNNLTGGES